MAPVGRFPHVEAVAETPAEPACGRDNIKLPLGVCLFECRENYPGDVSCSLQPIIERGSEPLQLGPTAWTQPDPTEGEPCSMPGVPA